MTRYLHWLHRAPWLWALICLAITFGSMTGLGGLSFSTDYQEYFSDENPELQAQRQLDRQFGSRDTLVLAVAAPAGQLFTLKNLEALRALTEAVENLPFATGAASVTNFYTPRADEDLIRSEPLIPEGDLSALDLQALRAEALNEPRILHGLIGASGDVAGVVGYFQLPDHDPGAEIGEVNAATRALTVQFEADHPTLKTYLIGSLPFNQAMADAATYDQRHLFPIAFGAMVLLLWLSLRGVNPTFITMAVVGMATLTALGIGGYLGMRLTTASMAAPLIILTLSISDCVHVLTTYLKARQQGAEAVAAVNTSLRVNALGVFLTTLTTVIGFLSFNTNDSPPFRDLGNLVAIGVVAAWVYAMVFLPCWLLITRPAGRTLRTLDLSRFAEWVIRRQRPLRWGGMAVVIALVSAIPLNHFGDDYVKFFGKELQFRQDTEFVSQHLMGVQYLEYGVPAPAGPGGVNEPEYLQHLEAFSDWLREQPGVRKVSNLNDLLKRLNQVMHGDDPAWYRLPESRALAAQYLLLFEISLPAGEDIASLVNHDKSMTRLTLGLNEMTNDQIRALDLRAQQWMTAHWPSAMQATGTGVPVLFARIARRNFESMVSGNVITFLLVSAIFIMAFRSWRVGGISLIPNFAPMLAGFGLWGLLVGQVGMSLSVVVSLTLGIVVDDTIHFLARYNQGRQQGMTPPDAVRHAYRDVGAALWITTLALTAGFGCLSMSSFLLTAHLGMLATIVIVMALVADFLLLPALLLWFDRDTSPPRSSSSPAR